MTGILGYVAPTTQPDVLGVHSLDQFNLVVPDLTLAQRFYGAFGLELREEAETFAVHTAGQAHRWGTIGEGQRKKHGYLSFGVFEHDFERFVERLVSRNITLLDPPYEFDFQWIVVRDHDGNLIEIKVAAKSSPAHKTKLTTGSASPRQKRRSNSVGDAANASTSARAHLNVHDQRGQSDRVLHKRTRDESSIAPAITSSSCTGYMSATTT